MDFFQKNNKRACTLIWIIRVGHYVFFEQPLREIGNLFSTIKRKFPHGKSKDHTNIYNSGNHSPSKRESHPGELLIYPGGQFYWLVEVTFPKEFVRTLV